MPTVPWVPDKGTDPEMKNAGAINKTSSGGSNVTLREEQARLGHRLVAWLSSSSELSYLVSDSITTPCNDIRGSPTPLGESACVGLMGESFAIWPPPTSAACPALHASLLCPHLQHVGFLRPLRAVGLLRRPECWSSFLL